jgi:uncharacterized protein (TIGR01777 family)
MPARSLLVTGATGFIGSALTRAAQRQGMSVTALVRSPASARRLADGLRVAAWSDVSAAVRGQSAVVHLAGEQAVGVRWTPAAKARILASRVETTERLVAALSEASPRPRVLVSASAVGIYGDRPGTELLDESARPGAGFLAEVCERWEASALTAADLGVRVVLARFGIVLGPGGGALEEMARPFRLFAGGPIGSGEQVVSWVHLEDAVGVVLSAVKDEAISGPVNVVAPGALTQAELAAELGRALSRPAWLRVPAVALRARFGEGAEPLLTGQRVVPAKMNAAGYVWHHPHIRGALAAALG